MCYNYYAELYRVGETLDITAFSTEWQDLICGRTVTSFFEFGCFSDYKAVFCKTLENRNRFAFSFTVRL